MAVSAGILGGKRAVPSEMGGTGVLQEGGPTDDGDGDQGTVSFRNIPTIKVCLQLLSSLVIAFHVIVHVFRNINIKEYHFLFVCMFICM